MSADPITPWVVLFAVCVCGALAGLASLVRAVTSLVEVVSKEERQREIDARAARPKAQLPSPDDKCAACGHRREVHAKGVCWGCDANNSCRKFALRGDQETQTRTPEEQFYDDTCAACGHRLGAHFLDEGCIWCKSSRKCMAFEARPQKSQAAREMLAKRLRDRS